MQKEESTRLRERVEEQNKESARLRADLNMLKIEVERLKGQGQGNSDHSLEVSNHYFLFIFISHKLHHIHHSQSFQSSIIIQIEYDSGCIGKECTRPESVATIRQTTIICE